jgi:hypothetical protein
MKNKMAKTGIIFTSLFILICTFAFANTDQIKIQNDENIQAAAEQAKLERMAEQIALEEAELESEPEIEDADESAEVESDTPAEFTEY